MKNILVLFSFLLTHFIFAQKEANHWYFGEYAGLDFSSGTPIAKLDGKLSTDEGCATISDSNGNLLFYTDGITVYNKNHEIMPNGTGLLGNSSSTHSAIIVPKPKSNNIYYIFTVGYTNSDKRGPLAYSEVDMSLDSGNGGITSNKNIILNDSVNEKVAAVKKSDADDGYWIVSHKYRSNEFITYSLTDSGINPTPIISQSGSNTEFNVTGQIKISPDNTKLAVGRVGEVQLFDFNNITGKITNPITLGAYGYGVEFSPNSNLLYTASYRSVSQFNIQSNTAADIISSKLTIAADNNGGFNSIQTGPDGKMYVSRLNRKFIDVIQKPNTIGTGCGYTLKGVDLNGRRARLGLPTFIQSFFRIDNVTYANTCFGETTEFTLNETVDSVTWNFGDPTSGVNNISSEINPTHVFSSAGTYTVTTTATLGTETSTITTEIVIYKQPTATKPNNILICDTDNDGFHNFNLTTQNTTILNGQSADNFQVDYYKSITDFDNNTPISDYTNYQNISEYQSQTIIASVKNKNNTTCIATTTFDIHVFESPKPSLSSDIPNLSYCDNTSVGTDADGRILFDLSEREVAILNGQSNTNFNITYFLDSAYTQQIPNADITSFQNTSPSQTIHVRVTNKSNSACLRDTSFKLEVYELPTVNTIVSLKQCDNDTDGFSFFNLTEANEKIINNSSSYKITYHKTQTQAEEGDAPIPNYIAYKNQTVSTDKVWARIENTNKCFRISEISLIISTTQIPLTYTREFYQCDDGINTSDGIATFDFSQVTNEILNIFPPSQDLIIKYYKSESDALAEINAIPNVQISNYQNTTSPNQESIFIRVDSKLDNDCLGLGQHITLNVETKPIVNIVSVEPQCDNDRDGLFAFDTSNIQSTLLGDQTDILVEYFNEDGVSLPSPLPNPFVTDSQSITIRLTNNLSQVINGKCYTETNINFIVNSVPIAHPISSLEECDDDTDGIVGFDTSNIESTILGNQTGMIVKYFDEEGIALPSPLPNPFHTVSQNVTVRIENPTYTLCFEETIVDFIVRQKPTVQVADEAIICMTNSPAQNISVTRPNSSYTYTWFNEKEEEIAIGETITIDKGGIYSVIATSPYNCYSVKDEISVIESEIASLTLNAIEITDDSENNTIIIDTANLGQGDYEYALLNTELDYVYEFQESPNFENLEGGFYTIQIRDKNGCGLVTKEVSVISYPSFFTPNNDGNNDVWTIKGFNTKFYPASKILIYNRYGKVIAKLKANNPIWDGTYNGVKVPSNDYWFSVQLIDNIGNLKIRKGHFSLLRR